MVALYMATLMIISGMPKESVVRFFCLFMRHSSKLARLHPQLKCGVVRSLVT